MLSTSSQTRQEALRWYRRCLRAAFAVAWETDADALFVLEETRRLFWQNRGIVDPKVIARKLREVEMRYALALHYNDPHPRLYHKTQGSMPESGVAYAAQMDSYLDHMRAPCTPSAEDDVANFGTLGGSARDEYIYEDLAGVTDVEGGQSQVDTVAVCEPVSTLSRTYKVR